LRLINRGFTNLETGVTQPEAERKQGIGHIAVRASFHGIIFEVLQLVGTSIEGDGKFPSGIVITEKNIGNRLTTRFARIPGLKDGVT
jgi:hypothetical protein